MTEADDYTPEQNAVDWSPIAAPPAEKQTFYASFGAGYRRSGFDYDWDGQLRPTVQHPVFPDKIDGRGYLEVVATDEGRARYLTGFYLNNQYSGLYPDTGMWDRWLEENTYYDGGIQAFLRENGGTLKLGTIDEEGLRWEAPRG